MMTPMAEDRRKLHWSKLAEAVRVAREARGLTQKDLADLAGISESSVQNLEKGYSRSRIPPSIAKIEPVLGWAEGSGMAILRGGAPAPDTEGRDNRTTPRIDRLRRNLPLRIVDELESDDPLLDSTVIQLPGVDGARMTVVVRGRPDATPEQIQEALLAWRQAERKLHRLPDGGDGEAKAANGS